MTAASRNHDPMEIKGRVGIEIFVVSFLIRFAGGAQNICCFFSDQICWRCASPKCSLIRSSESIDAAKICQTAKNGKIAPKEPVISDQSNTFSTDAKIYLTLMDCNYVCSCLFHSRTLYDVWCYIS